MMRSCSLAFLVTLILVTCLVVFANHEGSASRRNKKPRTAPELFARHCASCHGTDGRAKTSKGKFSHARDLTDANWHDDVTDERIFNSIMNGRDTSGNMPSFANKLKEKEVESLVIFVRGLKG